MKNDDIKNFIIDIDCLEKLSKWKNEANFFEVIGMTNREIKHSNFLAWLFDSNENHELGDKVIHKFLQKVIKNNYRDDENSEKLISVLLLNFDSFIIKREWKNLDIFLLSDDQKTTITIENKIYALESDGQTSKYRDSVNSLYPQYNNIFIYLTIDGNQATDIDNWLIADYSMVYDTIDEILNENVNLGIDIRLYLKNYLTMLRRNILTDKDLEKVCQEIYKKHKNALDLIYEYRPDNISTISDYIKNFIEENKNTYGLIFDEKYSCKTYVRFRNEFTERLAPAQLNSKIGNWGNGISMQYEFEILNNNRVTCVLTIANLEKEECHKIFEISQKNYDKCRIKKKNKPTNWTRAFRSSTLLDVEQVNGDFSESEEILSKNLHNLFHQEIPKFEKLILDNLINLNN